MTRTARDLVLDGLPRGARVDRIHQGPSWILAVVQGPGDRRAAGLAAIPHRLQGRCCLPAGRRPPDPRPEGGGSFVVLGDARDAVEWARLLRSATAGEAATGLAVANALLGLEPAPAAPVDGVDWLLERAPGRGVAVIGRFPFIDRRLRPIARQVWVFEREPAGGELPEADAGAILPRADVVVITGSTLANGSIDDLARLVRPEALLLMLGPSTPLTSTLFELGFDALSGVRVADPTRVAGSVLEGASFRRMAGLERVTLLPGHPPPAGW